MDRRARGPRGYPARSWALLVGAVLLCLQVTMPPSAAAHRAVASSSVTASDHSHAGSAAVDRSVPVAAHDEGRIARGAAHTPGPAGAVDLDVADRPGRPDASWCPTLAPGCRPAAADPAGMPRGRAPPA